jgi:hypothetical protein
LLMTAQDHKMTVNDDELKKLWSHRHELNESEWIRLYQLSEMIIRRCPQYNDEDFVTFFSSKIYMPVSTPREGNIQDSGVLISAGSICTFYKRFMADLYGKCSKVIQKSESIDNHEDDKPDIQLCKSVDDNPLNKIIDESIVHDDELNNAAKTFLQTAESWVPYFFAISFCGEGKNISATDFFRQYPVNSYAYKLKKLGIMLKRSKTPYHGYDETLLGKFIQKIGINIDNNPDQVRNILIILCNQSFVYVREQGLVK